MMFGFTIYRVKFSCMPQVSLYRFTLICYCCFKLSLTLHQHLAAGPFILVNLVPVLSPQAWAAVGSTLPLVQDYHLDLGIVQNCLLSSFIKETIENVNSFSFLFSFSFSDRVLRNPASSSSLSPLP